VADKQGGAKLDVPGGDADNVLDAIRFLRAVNLGSNGQLGKRTVILGGGNVAIDSARATKRLGCPDVTVVYRRTDQEMPAYPEEIEGARQEGVEFVYLCSPVEVLQEGAKVIGLKCIKNELGMPDESGRPRPVPIKGSEFVIECDVVISAIGQSMDAPWSKELELALTAQGTFPVNRHMKTMLPHVFAAGDAVRGPSTVIHAIADGHRAAESIHRFMKGLPLAPELAQSVESVEATEFVWKAVPSGFCEKAPRAKAGYMDQEERATCFLEECKGLAEDQGRSEAERCLNCGCCCMQSCPYDVIQFDGQAGTSHKCNLCYDRIVTGEKPVCAEVCLTDAISFGEYELLRQKALDSGYEIVEELSSTSHLYVK
jgi:heterodisulfide reductase subunit A